MPELHVGNAPCSWGMLEFEGSGDPVRFPQMLDELSASGYSGTELGNWGYMPTDPAALRNELTNRGLTMLGAFVPVALKHSSKHENGVKTALQTARLISSVAGATPPFLVLSDDNGADPVRTKLAGRVTPSASLSPPEWRTFCRGADLIARAVFSETGLRTVFHHHCAGYIESPTEICRLLESTDPDVLGLVFDSGHFVYGSGTNSPDTTGFLNSISDRVWYIHLKDCSPRVADAARTEEWDYFTALRNGVFCELGEGCIDFPALLRWLRSRQYSGYVVVEQDVLPGLGSPYESAKRNREYLLSIESNFSNPISLAEASL